MGMISRGRQPKEDEWYLDWIAYNMGRIPIMGSAVQMHIMRDWESGTSTFYQQNLDNIAKAIVHAAKGEPDKRDATALFRMAATTGAAFPSRLISVTQKLVSEESYTPGELFGIVHDPNK
jgi:hypothetical protein